MARRSHARQAHRGQSIVEYSLLIAFVFIGGVVAMGYLRGNTANVYLRQQQALVEPTFAAINYLAPTATPTVTPTPITSAAGSAGTGGTGGSLVAVGTPTPTVAAATTATATASATATVPPSNVRMSAYLNSDPNSNQTSYYIMQLYNDGLSSTSGLDARIFVNLSEVYTTGLTSSSVGIRTDWNECGAAVSGLQVWNAASRIFYLDIDWGSRTFAASSVCNLQLALSIYNPAVWNGANDPSVQGLTRGGYRNASGIPVYRNGTLVYGNEP